MSLEIACASDKYAIVVSDGLAWDPKTGRATAENSRKQIRLGNNIVVAAGGKVSDVESLFTTCEDSYRLALKHDAPDPIRVVRQAFSWRVGQSHFEGFGKTILSGLFVAKTPEGFCSFANAETMTKKSIL